MPFQNKKYKYELAKVSDGKEISDLLERTAFKGDISLIYSRRPNAVLSINKDCTASAVVVGREIETEKIKGIGVCQIYRMLVNGKYDNVAYLGGFRIDNDSCLNIVEAYKILENFIKENNVKYTFTTILEDNIYAQKMLTKKRKIMPYYLKTADFTVNIFAKNLKHNSNQTCEKIKENEKPQLKKFIDFYSKDKTFFPEIKHLDNFYVLKDNKNNILVCGKLWEQTDYKQLIIKKYSLKYKILKTVFNPVLKFFSYPKFPNENEIVKYETLSYVLYKNEKSLADFIQQMSSQIKYDFFVYGNTSELKEIKPSIKYKSYVYLVDWDKNIDIKDFNNIYMECALL